MFVINIIPVEDVLLKKEVTEIKFSCDLEKCKGACCTMESIFGAPLKEEEIIQINESLDEIMQFLTTRNIEEIKNNGFWEPKNDELMIRSVNNRDCVFVYFEKDIAKCGIEKAYSEGKIKFNKPVSCHLFPIRVSKFGGDVLRYEQYDECIPALEKGRKNNISLIEFCKNSLIRSYGKNWYSNLRRTFK